MITFILSIILLIVAYFTYGKFIDKLFGPNNEKSTPAYAKHDGVDYVPMNKHKNAMIQLLNI
ncbi:carbon starvation CstA family protein, partial [Virgibacillus sp.]